MDAAALLIGQFETLERQFKLVLKGLTLDQIHWQPDPRANSIGFLLWHTLYTWDEYFALIENRETSYEMEGWPDRFGFDTRGRGIEGSGMGTGFTPEDVAIVRPRPETLLEYFQSLQALTKSYLEAATGESLVRKVSVPWWRPKGNSAARIFAHIIAHSYFHIGEAQYMRGMVTRR